MTYRKVRGLGGVGSLLPLGNHGFPRVLCLRLGSPENPSLTGVVGPGASAAASCVSGSMWLFNMAATA